MPSSAIAERRGVPAGLGLMLLMFALGACANTPTDPTPRGGGGGLPSDTVEVGGVTVSVRLADTPAKRARGLGGVVSLAPTEGMLFIYPTAQERAFWMKGCLISLDLLFLDSAGKILSIHTLPAPPPGTPDEAMGRAPSGGRARFVLELNAGFAAQHEVRVGDRVGLGRFLKSEAR